MPIASPDIYAQMLNHARDQRFAYPAVNISSTETLNAALRGFAEAESDGIIQVSTGGAAFLSGTSVNNMVSGALALAAFAHEAAKNYPVNIALHTDHCPEDKLDTYVRPLIAKSIAEVEAGRNPIFQSHMWDGSAIPVERNLEIAKELLVQCRKAQIILEIEIGVVGGEEDGVVGAIDEKLYTTTDDLWATAQSLGTRFTCPADGRPAPADDQSDIPVRTESGDSAPAYLLAATFGNVHGVYKPGNVKLRPEILSEGQAFVAEKLGLEASSHPFDFVFHGGSGSELSEIRTAIDNGVVKMNIDTDTQYAYTRAIADHIFEHYEEVLKVDGEVGDKSFYDPRSYGKTAEKSMAKRIVRACEDLRSTGSTFSA